ncbi:hypothetical protein H257_04992 [Aphanomyces astaci]|uniref:Uncharacterized protein n=1 Tax=Aphanomyces astaci TaxID=112090 RepID=W4GRG3_APHAT|nr:hypothetical protein H257_04992 [Aphanomyces astaci]ETV82315.1 hypothetical protein H257_04992 [Aphanomyces astaci]|eukprot:XP_009827984.1 hypothetical protein H257_04992 [Aphanomyces astaci]
MTGATKGSRLTLPCAPCGMHFNATSLRSMSELALLVQLLLELSSLQASSNSGSRLWSSSSLPPRFLRHHSLKYTFLRSLFFSRHSFIFCSRWALFLAWFSRLYASRRSRFLMWYCLHCSLRLSRFASASSAVSNFLTMM